MERGSLKRRIKFLKSFKKDRNKLKYMQQCSNNCIEYICEACHNILKGNIKMPNSLRNKLKKHRKHTTACQSNTKNFCKKKTLIENSSW